MTYNTQEKAIIFIDGFINLEYKHKRAIINLYEDIGYLFDNPKPALNYLKENLGDNAYNIFKLSLNEKYISDLLQKYSDRNIKVLTEESDGYPSRLLGLDFNPLCLYCKGDTLLLNSDKTFAIVGSRKTAKAICSVTQEFASKLSLANVTIVTGIATGGDLSAIKGALDSGKIISVMASGSDYWNLDPNRDYVNKIIEKGGLVISEYSPEVPPRAYFYPIRNRIIAGLSDGLLIVSGDNKSGARHTANYALDYGREIFAFPYGITDVGGGLCNSLIKDGARLTETYQDISEVMGYSEAKEEKIQLSVKEQTVYDSIKQGANLVDDIVSKTNLKIFEIMPIITMLEIKGLIINSGGNEYVITANKK